jgi:hypothetical protein
MEPVNPPQLPPELAKPTSAPADNTKITDKQCSKCGKYIYPAEVNLSNSEKVKAVSGGALLCFEHIHVMTGGQEAQSAPKCKKCTKSLTQDELAFIAKYETDSLCQNCQQPS